MATGMGDRPKLYVVTRSGEEEPVHYDKITARLELLCKRDPPLLNVDPALICQSVVKSITPGCKTSDLDDLAAQVCASMEEESIEYVELAGRIVISNLHKESLSSFVELLEHFITYRNPKNQKHSPLVSAELLAFAQKHQTRIDAALCYDRDYALDYFGIITLQRTYLLHMPGQRYCIERPQHLFMRVALGMHLDNIDAGLETYEYLSRGYCIHATPTLFNAGTPHPQMSSCFLLRMQDDSIDGIYSTLRQCALISKHAGGIGVSVSNIRATNAYIRGTNGTSNGLVPMLRVFNDTARYVDQGGGKRKGAFAIYLEPWHADIVDFLQLKNVSGKEERRARDLFYGLWIPDLFMERVAEDGQWSLFCPDEAPGLCDAYGKEFVKLYTHYETVKGLARRTMRAQELWFAILDSQIESGTPYLLYKDPCNEKNQQKNLGTIYSSNLCTEVIQHTSENEVAVCNLASIALPAFVTDPTDILRGFDFAKLHKVAMAVTRNLNKVIDCNFYPIPEAGYTNRRNRPIGCGVQGLADVFALFHVAYDSVEARDLNKKIFETIYHGCVTASIELAQQYGPYETYGGSPASEGLLQFDLWGVRPFSEEQPECYPWPLWDWALTKKSLAQYGIRNSLLTCCMPTASTAQILRNQEGVEPYTSTVFKRGTNAGEFTVTNKHVVRDLQDRSLWSIALRKEIIENGGSLQDIDLVPARLKEIHKTIWELSQRVLIDLAADRAPYIDQSQSLNLYVGDPTYPVLTSMHFYAWRKGLKTGCYYLHKRPKVAPQKVTTQLKKSSCIQCEA